MTPARGQRELLEDIIEELRAKQPWRSRNDLVFEGMALVRETMVAQSHVLVTHSKSDGGAGNPAALGMIAFNELLHELSEIDRRQGGLVELTFLGGLSEREAAATLGIPAGDAELLLLKGQAWISGKLRSRDEFK